MINRSYEIGVNITTIRKNNNKSVRLKKQEIFQCVADKKLLF